MKKAKGVESLHGSWKWRPAHLIAASAVVYVFFVSSKLLRFVDNGVAGEGAALDRPSLASGEVLRLRRESELGVTHRSLPLVDNPAAGESPPHGASKRNESRLEDMAREAWDLGIKAWEEAEGFAASAEFNALDSALAGEKAERCPSSVSMAGGRSDDKAAATGHGSTEMMMFLPCGLAVGSSITIVGVPQLAHPEWVPQVARESGDGDGTVMVSQFVVELQGLKAVEGEEPPKILHMNPRLKGDWSHMPVIEHNTCYRMQWGKAMRCDGLPSNVDEDTVDGFRRCEEWERSDAVESKESKSWLQRFVGRANRPEVTWPFPLSEGNMFVLTIQAGGEGYHIFIGGRHITSFPYHTGFALEDATGLAIKGNVDIQSIYATSLPVSHPSFSLQHVLEMSEIWKAPPLSKTPVRLFIGVLSATNHFAERMAIRKTWMQSPEIRTTNVVAARFFVALNSRKEVNAALKKEADYFGDIVILPFIDRYELVVLKTIAICDYGVNNLSTAYIMKCDDDTFVRLNPVLRKLSIANGSSLYMGNLNFFHRPLRTGKWAVTIEEWPESVYPIYANGPGYVVSNDIAAFVAAQHANHTLRLFKMEDVSMGMWVGQFNATAAAAPVMYSHSLKFCQPGCVENYYTAHYQSPRQMVCLWDKLLRGRARCCNFK